jgi:hypothetical protein
LLGIDGVDRKPTLHQAFDHRTVRHLDRDQDRLGVGTAEARKPSRHFGKPGAAVAETSMADHGPARIDKTDVMDLGGPVDACKPPPFILHLDTLPLERAAVMLAGPCTGALRRELPTGHPSRPRAGARVPPQVLETQGALGRSRHVGP